MAEKVQFKDFVGPYLATLQKSFYGKLAECKICKNILKCEGGSTKGLHVHLKSVQWIHYIRIPSGR